MTRIPSRSGRRFAQLGCAATLCPALALALPAQRPSAAGPKCFGKHATIVGTSHADSLHGTAHHDVISAGSGGDTIKGRGDNDLICGEGGDDDISAGSGPDRVKGGLAQDGIEGDRGGDDLFGGPGEDIIGGGADDDAADLLEGGDANDELIGGPGGDDLNGGDGDDKLFGEQGDDQLDGGLDTDLCERGGTEESQTVINCEADLSVQVIGPATASPGPITFSVLVKNNGPSDVDGYNLSLDEHNMHLTCGGQSWEGTQPQSELPVGVTRVSTNLTSNCTDPGDPPCLESVDAKVTDVFLADDPVPDSDSDTHTTTVC